jgi:hypothetical protein
MVDFIDVICVYMFIHTEVDIGFCWVSSLIYS